MSISAMWTLSEYKGTAHPGYDPSIGTLIASISGNSFTRGGLDDLQTYWYWIRSVDTSGNTSAWVGPVSGVTTKPKKYPLSLRI